MLEFKQEYKDNQIEIIVDKARTHTTKPYSWQEFGKKKWLDQYKYSKYKYNYLLLNCCT